MKTIRTFILLLLCVVLLVSGSACGRREYVDADPIDPETLARPTELVLLNAEGELPKPTYSVCLTDSFDLPVAEATVSLSLNGKKLTSAVTDEKGIATLSPELVAGEHEVTFAFETSGIHRACTLTARVTAVEEANRNGVYVRGSAMNNVDLAELKDAGVGNVYLHQEVLSYASREALEAFIAAAAECEIAVHLWMICLHDAGDFVVPIVGQGYNQEYFNAEAERVREAAKIEGLSGLHFDYIRFDGEETRADKFRATEGGGGESAVTEFVMQMVTTARAHNDRLVFSGALMPEYGTLVPQYGQDVAALSEYLDFFVPMLYAGNYNEDLDWITECVRLYRQKHPELDFRPALLTYQSDASQYNKTQEELSAEVAACYEQDASGITLFYYDRGVTTLVPLNRAA